MKTVNRARITLATLAPLVVCLGIVFAVRATGDSVYCTLVAVIGGIAFTLFPGSVFGRHVHPTSTTPGAGVRWRGSAILTTLAASCLLFHCAPYNCREAVEGRALYAPLLEAIKEYRRQDAAVPDALGDLSPDFLDEIPGSPNEDGPKFPE